jgi:nitrate reductase assembly molybdenum cofactor insertion protein NarJ
MTSSSSTEQGSVTELLAEAAQWRLLGLLFTSPHADWREQVAGLAAEVADESLKIAARAALDQATQSGYYTAFGPGGPGAPREVSHRQSDLTGLYLAEVLACYNAFAYCPPRDEPPDHIGTEIDFVAYILLKQAYAVARNDGIQAGVSAQALQRFIQDHLATTAVPLAENLEASDIPYLTLAAANLSERVEAYCTNIVSSSTEPNQICDRELPICVTSDCCAELSN